MNGSLRKIHLGDVFTLRKEAGVTGLPVLSVTIRDGIVPRDSREHKVRSGLDHAKHLLVRRGDLVYNMMRMWQGASGIAISDGVVSPAYVVCVPTADIDPRFAHHLFHFPYMIYRFWAYSHGLTDDRRRLYFDDFARVPAEIPQIREQRLIADILDNYDQTFSQTQRLVEQKQRLKCGLMQQLLTGIRRFNDSKSNWRTCHIGDLLKEVRRYVSVEDDTPYRLVSVRRNSGGMFDREPRPGREIGYSKLMTVETGDFLIARRQVIHGAMTVVRERFHGAYVSDAYATLVPKDCSQLHMPYLDILSQTPKMYYSAFRCSYGVAIEKMVFHLEWFLREQLSIPDTIEEQKRIADVFGALDREVRQLERRLAMLQKQKRGMMQQLLTGKRRVSDAMLAKGGPP